MAAVTLESEEWYVLCNWLRERENRLMYSLRSKSREWEFVHDLRRKIESRDAGTETEGIPQTVALSERQVEYLRSYLGRRAWRLLLLRPWRSRERRDLRHLRDHLLEEVGRGKSE